VNAALWLFPLLGYILGSVLPADYVVRAILGAPPDDYGENLGTAATWRLVGPLPSLVVLAYDLFKGFFPVYLASHLAASPAVVVASAMTPVIGHNWPVHRGFRGGRGMAAAIGAVSCLAPTIFIPAVLVGGVVALYKRRTPWVAFVGLPLGLIMAVYFQLPAYKLVAFVAIGLILLLRQLQWGDWS